MQLPAEVLAVVHVDVVINVLVHHVRLKHHNTCVRLTLSELSPIFSDCHLHKRLSHLSRGRHICEGKVYRKDRSLASRPFPPSGDAPRGLEHRATSPSATHQAVPSRVEQEVQRPNVFWGQDAHFSNWTPILHDSRALQL